MADASRRAVFLDRDGTIAADPGSLHQLGKVRLRAGPRGATGVGRTGCCWVGDRLSVGEPARERGGRALLVGTGGGATYVGKARALRSPVVADLAAAAAEIVHGA